MTGGDGFRAMSNEYSNEYSKEYSVVHAWLVAHCLGFATQNGAISSYV
jgi:hypothetical protein